MRMDSLDREREEPKEFRPSTSCLEQGETRDRCHDRGFVARLRKIRSLPDQASFPKSPCTE